MLCSGSGRYEGSCVLFLQHGLPAYGLVRQEQEGPPESMIVYPQCSSPCGGDPLLIPIP
jgi:hypothetical protein